MEEDVCTEQTSTLESTMESDQTSSIDELRVQSQEPDPPDPPTLLEDSGKEDAQALSKDLEE